MEVLSHIHVCSFITSASLFCDVNRILNKPYIKALGRRIIELRSLKNLSQEELANLADIPVNQVGRIERGEINTTVSTIYVIAKSLGLTVSELHDFPFSEKGKKK